MRDIYRRATNRKRQLTAERKRRIEHRLRREGYSRKQAMTEAARRVSVTGAG